MLRRTALALSAVALLAAASAQPARSAPPPTLTGQRFSDVDRFLPPGSGNLSLSCRRNPDGTETLSFRASNRSALFDPDSGTFIEYSGTFTETGQLTVRGSDPQDFDKDLLSLKADFTIDFIDGRGQVSGSKRLPAPLADRVNVGCAEDQQQGLYDIRFIPVSYSATITTTGGVFADRGQASFHIERLSTEPSAHEFAESFTSDLAATEQQGSILFGKRTPGASFSAMSANAKRAVAFPLYFPATVRKLHAYIDGKGSTSGSQTLRGVLYAHGPGGAPGALLGRTFQFTVPAGMSGRWLELYLAPPVRLSRGVYWIGLHSGTNHGVARFAWDPMDGSRRFNIDNYGDGPSNPFGSAPLDNQQMSIFASGSY